MPESTCLHIQDRESGPIRVVELPWISVRIGRAAYCEVRLPDAQVAEEACRLTRRGRTWSLIPSTAQLPILFEGQPLDRPCPLPFDVPFRMGPYCLTLRHDLAAEPNWEIYPAQTPVASVGPRPADGLSATPPVTADFGSAEMKAGTAAYPAESEGSRRLDSEEWRARWKAAEAHLKSRASRLDVGRQRDAFPTSPDPLREPDRSRLRASVTPTTPGGSPTRPVPIPTARKIDSAWNTTRTEPTPATSPLGPALRPTAEAATDRSVGIAANSDDPTLSPPPVQIETVASFDSGQPLIEQDWTDIIAAAVDATAEHASPVEPQPLGDDPQPLTLAAPESPESPRPAAVRSDLPTDADIPASEFTVSTAEPPGSVPSAPIDRRPKPRRPRERPAGGRRTEPLRRARAETAVPDSAADSEADTPGFIEPELPSVRDILVNHRNSPGPRPAVERGLRGRRAIPTVSQEPNQWTVPGWLVLPPVGAFMLGVGALSCLLSWWWVADASTAAVLTQRLLATDGSGRRRPLPPNLAPPGGRWIRTTAEHLAHWAIYAAGSDDQDPYPPSEAQALVTQALEISPLNPTARLAMAQLEGAGRDGAGRIRGLGLSRDSVSLAWSARRLMDAGKKEASLRLYYRALCAAVEGGLSRSAIPRFADDPLVRRYFLPAEDAVRDIVAELATRDGLEFREWSRALPRRPTVVLATARLLREQGRSEADSLLDDLLGDGWTQSEAGRDDPRLLAARAEAFGLRSRWKEAAEQYRQAIERVDNDLIRRSWWFNLADISQRLSDESQRQAAFRAILAAQSSDDIARRVSQIQRSGHAKPRVREGYGLLKAN
jgi:hypothetical protein